MQRFLLQIEGRGMSFCGLIPPHRLAGHHAKGCPLPIGHEGPHIAEDTLYGRIEWETAWDCSCSDCESSDAADWCVDWSRAPAEQPLQIGDRVPMPPRKLDIRPAFTGAGAPSFKPARNGKK